MSLRRPTLGSYSLLLGLRGFFDGIVLDQILQWRRMLTSADYPPNSVELQQVEPSQSLLNPQAYSVPRAALPD
jgi:uncharacterized membrane protein